MNKYIISLALFLFWCSYIFSQTLPEIIPPSPTAYELGKYGQVPVGLFTGTPNVSIPLYTYKTKNLSVPISLSYNSNGIKVGQMSSNVGLGWSLNSGGVITRIVRDKPDEERTVLIPENIGSVNDNNDAINYFFNAAQSDYDSEIDVYMFNFLGFSGKFVLNNSGEFVLLPKQNMSISSYSENIGGFIKTGFKFIDNKGIVYKFLDEEYNETRTSGNGLDILGAPAITAWYLSKIEHPNGDVIEFTYEAFNYFYLSGKSESLEIATPTYQSGCNGATGTSAGYTISPELTNRLTIAGKRLTKIKATHAEVGEVLLSSSISHPETSSKKMLSNLTIKDKNLVMTEKIDLDYLSTDNKRVFLKDVTFLNPDKNYQFDYIDPNGVPERLSKSQDYWGYFNGKNNLYGFPNPQDDYIRELINTGFHVYDVGGDKSIDSSYAEKGLLNKITYPTKGYNAFEYESNSYYGQNTTSTQINKNLYISANTDENGAGSNYEVSDVTQTISFDHKAEFDVGVFFNSDECDSFMDVAKSKALITIVDSHGDDVVIQELYQSGYVSVGTNSILVSENSSNTHFYLDLKAGHTYTFKVKPTFTCVRSFLSLSYFEQITTNTNNTNINLGGLRIKYVKSFDAELNIENITRYYYGKKETPTLSSADKGGKPFYVSNKTSRIPCDVSGQSISLCGYIDLFYQSLNSNSLRQLYNSSSNGSIYYNYVTVSHGGDNFENGGEEHEFIINNDVQGKVLYGNQIDSSPWVNIGWSNGLEKKSVLFKKGLLNSLIVLKETFNSYIEDTRLFDKVYGYSVLKKFDLLCTYSQPDLRNLENLDIMEYTVNSYWHYLDQTIEKQYDLNGLNPIISTTNYFYDNPEHLQISRVETVNSTGKLTQNKTLYPDDVDTNTILYDNTIIKGNALSDTSYNAIKRLQGSDLHQTSTPIQIETTVKDINGNIISNSLQRTNFSEPYSNVILPEYIQTSKGSNDLEDKIQFQSYYPNGNIKEVSKTDGSHIYYLWGYNGQYPIAKIENFSTSQISTEVQNLIIAAEDAANLDDDRTLDYLGQEGDLREALDNIRNNVALSNTIMSSYTYDPLIGVTSMTDARGYTIYYEYDEFNRLEHVKDAEGKLVSETQYNYKN
jgi:hypothetical protein